MCIFDFFLKVEDTQMHKREFKQLRLMGLQDRIVSVYAVFALLLVIN